MEYTLVEAKTMLDLITGMSLYAFPLVLSLIGPLFYLSVKKLLGLQVAASAQAGAPSVAGNIRSFFFLEGSKTDRIVFWTCIALFIGGIGILKWGEFDKDAIRRRLIALQSYYMNQQILSMNVATVSESTAFSQKEIVEVTRNYPDKFILTGNTLHNTDSVYIKSYHEKYSTILGDYIAYHMKNGFSVNLEHIFQPGEGIRNYFLKNTILYYLSKTENRQKYFLNSYNKDTTYLIKAN